jgi:sugar/nucleoside kinase (ribokinase family)
MVPEPGPAAALVTFGKTLALISAVHPGPLRHQAEMHLGIGGTESNVAVGVRRLGVGAAWVGRVGDDEFGALLEKVASLGPREVVLKRGGDGASALVDGELLETQAIRVPVVDTVGAGDAFVAGWLSEWISGAPARQRLRTAVQCGAFACTVTSDWQGAPSRAELERWHDGGDPVRR